MKIQPLTVGPIVGESTPKRVRIWGRGEVRFIDNELSRCFGAIRWKDYGADKYNNSLCFKMNPNFDLTGIAVLERLSANTYYEYEIGYFFSDAELEDLSIKNANWDDASYGYFQTASDIDTDPRTFAIGSCRYLLNIFGGSFFDNRGDKTFRAINQQIDEDGTEFNQLIMMGDQIYADDLNIINPIKTVREFYERYRHAFTQKHLRNLMSHVSTYMTLDDHEIENNWPRKSTSKDWKTIYPNAIHAYQTYQLSHSPCIPIRRGKLHGTPQKFWYKYSDGCCDVFVTDTRTERTLGKANVREIISTLQMQALKRWLSDGSGRVKIVVSSVPFFPDASSGKDKDKWSRFNRQRQELISHISSREITKVVFFSGDVHASFSGELLMPNGNKLIAIVSSAFFWPYPHQTSRKFKLKGTIDGGIAGECTLSNFTPVVADDNFTKVRISPSQTTVQVYGRKCDLCHEHVHRF